MGVVIYFFILNNSLLMFEDILQLQILGIKN